MKLLVKFNLVFLVVFVIGLALAIAMARALLAQAAREDSTEGARLLLASAAAVANYTAKQINPLLETQMKYNFMPQSVPSYSAAETLSTLQKTYPEYSFKSAMLNPTNPRDRAVAWEEDLITKFKSAPDLKEIVGQRDTPTGKMLYLAQPIRLPDAACLVCHSTPEAAPPTMLASYGPANGFNWKMGEVLGARVASVPMAVPLKRADESLKVVVAALTGLFLLVGLSLNLMLWRLVIHPVSKLSGLADRVSMGDLEAPAFEIKSKDEIGVLAESLGRMRRSVVQAMKMLEG